jgi:hypothetical protein
MTEQEGERERGIRDVGKTGDEIVKGKCGPSWFKLAKTR